MGQQISVETFVSSKDPEGNKYWTSFDPYPFKVGSKKLVYMGILNGDGPLAGQKCVVKTVRKGAIGHRDWMLESKRAKIARCLARSYNQMMPRGERKITFNCPIMADIDTMSDCLCINDILGKPKKKWNDAESVSIELYLKGQFEDFEYGWVNPSDLVVPEAFAHYTWCRSEGTMLVSNLQGVKTRIAYHLTGPTIHSEGVEFGSSDCGYDGIKSFFKLHKCNTICKNWPRLGDGTDMQRWGECPVTQDRYPSAPPLSSFPVPLTPPPYKEQPDPYYWNSQNKPQQYHRSPVPSRQNSREIFPWNDREPIEPQYSRDVATYQQSENRSSLWQHGDGQGLVLDWREEFVNQGMMYGSRYRNDNPVFQDASGMQLMWVIKQMNCAMYAQPPPPYYVCTERGNANTQVGVYNTHNAPADESDYFLGGSDRKCLLPPPPYSEENVDPRCEFVTYL